MALARACAASQPRSNASLKRADHRLGCQRIRLRESQYSLSVHLDQADESCRIAALTQQIEKLKEENDRLRSQRIDPNPFAIDVPKPSRINIDAFASSPGHLDHSNCTAPGSELAKLSALLTPDQLEVLVAFYDTELRKFSPSALAFLLSSVVSDHGNSDARIHGSCPCCQESACSLRDLHHCLSLPPLDRATKGTPRQSIGRIDASSHRSAPRHYARLSHTQHQRCPSSDPARALAA